MTTGDDAGMLQERVSLEEDEIIETQTSHENIVAESIKQCQVCGAPARLCHPDLLQQTMQALMGVATATADSALCAQCSSLAAQACHLHSQLQELDDQLRYLHMQMLYGHLEKKDSEKSTKKFHRGHEGDGGPGITQLSCRLCDEQQGSTSALLRHLRLQHGAGAPPGVKCTTTMCEPCTVCRCGQAAGSVATRNSPTSGGAGDPEHGGASNPTAEDTTAPLSAAPTTEPSPAQDQLACTACPQQFASAAQRRRHQRQAHPRLLAHACRLCTKQFPSPSKLRIHEDSHAGAKPHACGTCGRRYHSAQKLHVHARSHTGERPFVCHMCGRTFASAAYLAQHELTHSGRRPHQCNVCGKQFTQRGTMTKHVRNVHAALAAQRQEASAAQGVAIVTDLCSTGTVPVQKLDPRAS